MSDDPLVLLRERISKINREVLELLNERIRVAGQIRAVKQERGVALFDPEREARMLVELEQANSGPLSTSQLQDIFKHVFRLSLSHMEQENLGALRVRRRPGEPERQVSVRGRQVGGTAPCLIAGPCAVESAEQIEQTAARLAALGCGFLRGGAFKPRSSPYSFQGLGVDGWKLLRQAADQHGMAVVSEVVDPRHLEDAARFVDVLQVGARNMYNYELLKALGELGKPVLLKRALSATLEELLLSAEYVASRGNEQIIFCERGVRSFERWTRATLDISAVPLLKQLTPHPVIVDVSHAAGRRDLFVPLARACIAAGADGIMIETHPSPATARSDSDQQIDLEAAEQFVREVFG